jgi:hypothetical protein
MNNSVHVDTNVSRETGSNRQRAQRGTTKCPHCDRPRVESSAYCREHRNAAQKEFRRRQREKMQALLKMVGTWVDPA